MSSNRTRIAATAVTSVLTLMLATLGVVFSATSASAHGSTQDPPSRTYGCRFLTPDNEMCNQAWTSNSQALYDWNEVNIGSAAGNHQALIPDGQLCSAGRAKYAAFNTASDKWPVTNLKPGTDGKYTLQWQNTAPHATAYYRVYITKPGFDVKAAPLKWSDLDFVYDSGPSAPTAAEVLRTSLPQRSTHSIIYTIWQRSDSQEAFYACNDVTVNAAGTPTPTPTPTTATPTPTPTSTTPPVANGGVTLALKKTDEWGSGRNYDATVTNTSGSAKASWSVSLPWPNNVEPWNATASYSGGQVTLGNVEWNGSLASGAGITFGFTDRSYVPPTATTCSAKLNGVAVPCSIGGAPSPTATPTPTPTTASPTPTPTPTPTSTTASPTPTPTGTTVGGVTTAVQVTTDWGTGYCTNVTVSTASAAPITWSVKVPVAKGKVSSLWSADYSVANNTITAKGKAWNATVKAGQPATWGFCAG